jgi:hypothetical protein
MNKEKHIYYLTYQDFPAQTANSQQTISTCKYFSRNEYSVTLFFPLRSISSDDNYENLKKYYEIKNDIFTVKGLKHKNNFETSKRFKKIRYIISHSSWAYKSVNEVLKNYSLPSIFFTRSDWVFFFLSQKNLSVVFECHKITKLRKIIMKKSIKKNTSKIIFINQSLKNISNIDKKYESRLCIQGAGYDSDYFFSSKNKIDKQVIYAGTLSRLGNDRNLDFIFKSFSDERLANFRLKVYGVVESEVNKLQKKYKYLSNVFFSKHISKTELGKELAVSEIGILASSADPYSKFYTDPLKFYEYVASGLKILATNFPAHKNLDSENIYFFEHQNEDSFKTALLESIKQDAPNYQLQNKSMDSRIKNIINFIS